MNNIIISALSLFVVLIRQVNVTESEKNDDDDLNHNEF